MKLQKTKDEVNNFIRSQLGKNEFQDGELDHSQMNELILSGGQTIPEKKETPAKPLDPAQVVKVLEMMDNEHLTYSQAKAKVLEEEAKKTVTSKQMSALIRGEHAKHKAIQNHRTVNNKDESK